MAQLKTKMRTLCRLVSTGTMTLLAAVYCPLLCAEVAVAEVSPSALADRLMLEVIDSYAEMHTGPGRGYPVFYVVEQGEKIEVLTRRPDWYEVRTARGKIGWVTAAHIARTLQQTGEPADLPTVSYGDYQKNRWRVGVVGSLFSAGELADADGFSASLGYSPLAWLGGELEIGKFYKTDVSGSIINANMVLEPFSSHRLSPAVILGYGVIHGELQPKEVEQNIDSFNFMLWGVRLNYYLGRNFIIRTEYRSNYLDIDSENSEASAQWNLGFTTFF